MRTAGQALPGGPTYSTSPVDLPMRERTTDLAAWRAGLEEKARRSRELTGTIRRAETEQTPVVGYPEPAPFVDEVGGQPEAPTTPPASQPAPEPSSAPQPVTPVGPEPERVERPAAATPKPKPPAKPSPAAAVSAERAAIVTAYVDGGTAPAVAARFGTTPKRVRALVRAAGGQLRDDRATRSGGRGHRLELDRPDLIDQVRRRYVDEGRSIAQTAGAIGISENAVRRIMDEYDIPARPPAHVPRGDEPLTRPDPAAGQKNHAVQLKALMVEHGTDSATVRAWAKENDVTCPPRGLPSRKVIEAWIAANISTLEIPIASEPSEDRTPAPGTEPQAEPEHVDDPCLEHPDEPCHHEPLEDPDDPAPQPEAEERVELDPYTRLVILNTVSQLAAALRLLPEVKLFSSGAPSARAAIDRKIAELVGRL